MRTLINGYSGVSIDNDLYLKIKIEKEYKRMMDETKLILGEFNEKHKKIFC